MYLCAPASAMKAFALLALAAPFVAEAQQALDVPGFGRIEVNLECMCDAFSSLLYKLESASY